MCRRIAASLCAMALSVLPSAGLPATMQAFIPGSAPCKGACSIEWAMAQAGVPAGDPQPVLIPVGSTIQWMSYATDGVPHSRWGSMYVATEMPLPGVGYWVTVNGQQMLFARLDACENWALIQPVTSPVVTNAATAEQSQTVIGGGGGGGSGFSGGFGLGSGGGGGSNLTESQRITDLTEPTADAPMVEPSPSVVPLPPGLLLMLTAFLAPFALFRRPRL